MARQRRSRLKAVRREKNKRKTLRKKMKRERRAFAAFQQDMNKFIAENTEPVPPETEVIDERTSNANRDPRLRRQRAFGMLSTMGRSSYLGGGLSPMGGGL